MYKIDKNVPMPPKTRSYNAKYPWADMKVGDSFFVPDPNKRNTLTSSASYAGHRRGWSFSVYLATEKGVEGVRVWRMK